MEDKLALSISGNDNVELVEARGKLEEKQKTLEKIFAEAKTADGKTDFRKVKALGEGKSSAEVRDEVNKLNTECADLWKTCLGLAKAQDGPALLQKINDARMKHPDPDLDPDPANPDHAKVFRQKGAGRMVTESAAFKEWHKGGHNGGLDVHLDVLPSDVLGGVGYKTLMETTAGWAPESIRLPGWTDGVSRPIQVLDIIPMATTGFAAVAYMEETTRTHGAAEAAEGAAYGESTFAFTARSVTVRKIADSLPVTDEQIEDVPAMDGYINNRLMFGVRQRLDLQILVGDGIAPNIEGIENVTGIQTQALGTDSVPDAFHKAMTLVRVTGRAIPTHHVMNPTDWEGVRLLTTADGIYIWGPPSQRGMETMWGLPVIQQDADAAGTGYVGSFLPQWITLFERRGIDVQVGYTGSQFTEGERTVRADMRAALVLFRPVAFCTVTGL